MADPRVTVLVPTHSHGPLLVPAVRSALRQTVEDLEVLIVGDGATPPTLEAARALEREDPRVRLFAFPKGPRHGEVHRHAVLTGHARGAAVLYLSDDDLWLPDHAERLLGLLREADFAHALSTWILPDGTVQATFMDIGTPHHRERVRTGALTPSLTVGAHTMECYRRLPHGWRTTPDGIPTDSWMWRQLLDCDWVRAASGRTPTVVHLPTPARRDWPPERRLAELEDYEAAIADPAWRLAHTEALLDKAIEEDVWFAAQAAHLQEWGDRLSGEASALWDRCVALEDELARLRR